MKLRKKILALVFVVAMMVGSSFDAKATREICLDGSVECTNGEGGFTFAICGSLAEVEEFLDFLAEYYC